MFFYVGLKIASLRDNLPGKVIVIIGNFRSLNTAHLNSYINKTKQKMMKTRTRIHK